MTTSDARRYQNLRAHLGYLKLNDAADALNSVLDSARNDGLSLTAALERLLEIEVDAQVRNVLMGLHPAPTERVRQSNRCANVRAMPRRPHPRRVGTPQDVADAALCLAGPESSYIHAITLSVDGGLINTL